MRHIIVLETDLNEVSIGTLITIKPTGITFKLLQFINLSLHNVVLALNEHVSIHL